MTTHVTACKYICMPVDNDPKGVWQES